MPLVAEWLRSFGFSFVGLTLLFAVAFARTNIDFPIRGRALLAGVVLAILVIGAGMSATAIVLLHSQGETIRREPRPAELYSRGDRVR
jgi:hypothetical protein